jgi:hypothetical protein
LDVAVKVRHPHVVEESFVDIDIIFAFINFMGWVKGGGEAGGRMIIPVTKNEFQVKSCTAQPLILKFPLSQHTRHKRIDLKV